MQQERQHHPCLRLPFSLLPAHPHLPLQTLSLLRI